MSALDSLGARSMTPMRSILEALDWWRWKPVYDGFIVDGIGVGALRAVSAVAEDKRRAVVYVPELGEITLDTTSSLRGSRLDARWIDPVNAHSVPAAGTPLESSQSLKLRPPKQNSSGYGDWVLVLEST